MGLNLNESHDESFESNCSPTRITFWGCFLMVEALVWCLIVGYFCCWPRRNFYSRICSNFERTESICAFWAFRKRSSWAVVDVRDFGKSCARLAESYSLRGAPKSSIRFCFARCSSTFDRFVEFGSSLFERRVFGFSRRFELSSFRWSLFGDVRSDPAVSFAAF